MHIIGFFKIVAFIRHQTAIIRTTVQPNFVIIRWKVSYYMKTFVIFDFVLRAMEVTIRRVVDVVVKIDTLILLQLKKRKHTTFTVYNYEYVLLT